MFCPTCGKEINSAAVICPHCGCYTNNNQNNNAPYQQSTSSDYLVISNFHSQAKTIRNLGIVAALLMFGIGFIFSIIIAVKAPSVQIPNITTVDQKELALYEDAKRKLDLGKRLAACPLIAIGICIIIATIGFSM